MSSVHFLYAHTLNSILIYLDTLGIIHKPAALALPGSSLEEQTLGLHPRPTESESVFEQDSQVGPDSDSLVLLLS